MLHKKIIRTATIGIRFGDDELSKIEDASEIEKIPVSTWIRSVVLKKVEELK